jgi:hypothetical protein
VNSRADRERQNQLWRESVEAGKRGDLELSARKRREWQRVDPLRARRQEERMARRAALELGSTIVLVTDAGRAMQTVRLRIIERNRRWPDPTGRKLLALADRVLADVRELVVVLSRWRAEARRARPGNDRRPSVPVLARRHRWLCRVRGSRAPPDKPRPRCNPHRSAPA